MTIDGTLTRFCTSSNHRSEAGFRAPAEEDPAAIDLVVILLARLPRNADSTLQ